ncbi:ribonuclease HI [Bdellovibrio sp. ZAP7]|uniref:ribonuclease H family protein n=1 Tax=Bdellovibrio sp. ZAP7 TaxID=2231053 RepID=UPI0011570923|nr:ribonuclease H [Bdellovibrio sp. ZAP7]QDK45873.1 ribonuclease HI [Bdellovibrio sp. ZAP7]
MYRFWQRVLRLFSGNVFEIYTDGSLKHGKGAWAYVISRRGKILSEDSAGQKKTSSNRMEFQAAIEALKALPENSRAKLYTDSRVMLEALEKSPRWSANGWVKNQGQPIPEVDLIRELYTLQCQHRIEWRWVKAHSGIEFNERCDELCIRARSKDLEI